MPTTDRPAAPLIPATAELLEGWHGPVVLTWHSGPRGNPSRGAAALGGIFDEWGDVHIPLGELASLDGILLDLRRPEVQDRVSRVWWGTPDVRLHVDEAYRRGMLERPGRGTIAVSWRPEWGDCLHAPGLADLPDTDTLAWALWECWRAMEDR